MEIDTRYAGPQAPVEDAPLRRYYSPWQVFVAAMIAGPPAAAHFIARFQTSLGQTRKAAATQVGSVVVLLVYFGLATIPQAFWVTMGLSVVIAEAYRRYAAKVLRDTLANDRARLWSRYSWWRALSISLGILLLLLFVLVLVLVILQSLGIRVLH